MNNARRIAIHMQRGGHICAIRKNGLYEYTVAVIQLVLNDLCRPARKALVVMLKAHVVVFQLNRAPAVGTALAVQR